MDDRAQPRGVRRLFRLAYEPPRRCPHCHGRQARERSGVPGPLFDAVVVATCVVLGLASFL